MKLLIQLTFNNGLGNLYCGVVEILDYVKNFKDLGYSCELVFALNGTWNGNKFIDKINFEEIFDMSTIVFFDRVRNFDKSINTKIFEDYTYHSTQYGPKEPGVHWWDVFFDVIPEIDFEKKPYNVETFLSGINIPNILPKFTKEIYDLCENLTREKKANAVIHMRYFDFRIDPEQEFKTLSSHLAHQMNKLEGVYHFCSNNKFAIDVFSENNNVETFQFTNEELFSNDHNYYFGSKFVENSLLKKRLFENIAEMVYLKNFEHIYYYTSFGWISTFLYYSLVNNHNLNLIPLNKLLNFEIPHET